MNPRLPTHCNQRPVSIRDNHPRIHNLDISKYSLDEMYAIFGLLRDTVSVQDLKNAKKKVLMTHPDKSQLPPDYFLFYKKVLEHLVADYASQRKEDYGTQQMATLSQNGCVYQSDNMGHDEDPAYRAHINAMSKNNKFLAEFNRVYEETIQPTSRPDYNQWFRQADSAYNVEAKSQADMNRALDEVKRRQQSLVQYRGVQEIQAMGGGSEFLDETEEEYARKYISTDNPFSKLKYDDLRRVHKDETVLSVNYMNAPQTSGRTMDKYTQERDTSQYATMTKEESNRLLAQEEHARLAKYRERHEYHLQKQKELEDRHERARLMFRQLK